MGNVNTIAYALVGAVVAGEHYTDKDGKVLPVQRSDMRRRLSPQRRRLGLDLNQVHVGMRVNSHWRTPYGQSGNVAEAVVRKYDCTTAKFTLCFNDGSQQANIPLEYIVKELAYDKGMRVKSFLPSYQEDAKVPCCDSKKRQYDALRCCGDCYTHPAVIMQVADQTLDLKFDNHGHQTNIPFNLLWRVLDYKEGMRVQSYYKPPGNRDKSAQTAPAVITRVYSDCLDLQFDVGKYQSFYQSISFSWIESMLQYEVDMKVKSHFDVLDNGKYKKRRNPTCLQLRE